MNVPLNIESCKSLVRGRSVRSALRSRSDSLDERRVRTHPEPSEAPTAPANRAEAQQETGR